MVVCIRCFNMCSQTKRSHVIPRTKVHCVGELRLCQLVSFSFLTDHPQYLSSRSTLSPPVSTPHPSCIHICTNTYIHLKPLKPPATPALSLMEYRCYQHAARSRGGWITLFALFKTLATYFSPHLLYNQSRSKTGK